MSSLCPIFGMVPKYTGVWLDYSLKVLLCVVKKNSMKQFEVRWPSEEEIRASNVLLENNRVHGQLLKGVFAVTNGGHMPCADYLDAHFQNAYFEGYTKTVEVTNLFFWNFIGDIIHAAINFLERCHDTKLAEMSGLYLLKLSDEMNPAGLAELGDSAFVNNRTETNGKAIRGRKPNEKRDIPESVDLDEIDIII